MPYYDFEHTDSGEITAVFFHMNDEKIFNGDDNSQPGKWKRLFSAPCAAISSMTDPYSQKDFVAATTNKKGATVGEMWQRSAEESKRRADRNGGVDEVKLKHYSEYEKKTGLKHPRQTYEDTGKRAKEIVKNLGFGS